MLLLFNIEKSCFCCWVSSRQFLVKCFLQFGWLSLTTALCASSFLPDLCFLKAYPAHASVNTGTFCCLVCFIAENEPEETGMKSKFGNIPWKWAWMDSLGGDFSGWVGSSQPLERGSKGNMGNGTWMTSRKGKNNDKSRGMKRDFIKQVSDPTLMLCRGRRAVCWGDPTLGSLLYKSQEVETTNPSVSWVG